MILPQERKQSKKTQGRVEEDQGEASGPPKAQKDTPWEIVTTVARGVLLHICLLLKKRTLNLRLSLPCGYAIQESNALSAYFYQNVITNRKTVMEDFNLAKRGTFVTSASVSILYSFHLSHNCRVS